METAKWPQNRPGHNIDIDDKVKCKFNLFLCSLSIEGAIQLSFKFDVDPAMPLA